MRTRDAVTLELKEEQMMGHSIKSFRQVQMNNINLLSANETCKNIVINLEELGNSGPAFLKAVLKMVELRSQKRIAVTENASLESL